MSASWSASLARAFIWDMYGPALLLPGEASRIIRAEALIP